MPNQEPPVEVPVHMTRGGVITWYVQARDLAKPEADLPKCRSCGAPLLWAETNKGKNNPLDPAPDDDGVYTSHFATCSNAPAHRRRSNG